MTSLRRSTGPFRGRRGTVAVNVAKSERLLVAGLLDEVADLLDPDPDVEPDVEPDGDPDVEPDGDPAGDLWHAFERSVTIDPPHDPAVQRLLPDGSRDDPVLSQSFRRLTEHSLRLSKRTALHLASQALRRPDPLSLDRNEAHALLKGLTDLRLVLAERLDLRTDHDAAALHLQLELVSARARAAEESGEAEQIGEGERRWLGMAATYEALTWWQESLVSAVH